MGWVGVGVEGEGELEGGGVETAGEFLKIRHCQVYEGCEVGFIYFV